MLTLKAFAKVNLVLEVLGSQPSLWREVARLALQRQRYSLATLHERALGGIPQRLVVTLVRLAAFYGNSEPEGLALRVRLSQHDLAAMLAKSLPGKVVAEGRIWTPEQAREALRRGAFAVVVGTAITRPVDIVKRFAAALRP